MVGKDFTSALQSAAVLQSMRLLQLELDDVLWCLLLYSRRMFSSFPLRVSSKAGDESVARAYSTL